MRAWFIRLARSVGSGASASAVEAGRDKVLRSSGNVDGRDCAVYSDGQRACTFDDLTKDRVKVQVRADTQAPRAQLRHPVSQPFYTTSASRIVHSTNYIIADCFAGHLPGLDVGPPLLSDTR